MEAYEQHVQETLAGMVQAERIEWIGEEAKATMANYLNGTIDTAMIETVRNILVAKADSFGILPQQISDHVYTP